MTSRVKHLLLCVGLCVFADAAHSANVTEATTDRAIVLNLAASDLTNLAQAIENGYFADKLTGHIDTPISEDRWFGHVSARGISYSLRVDDLTIAPQRDRILVEIRLSDVRIDIDRIDFNASGSRYCTNMALHTNGNAIAGRAAIAPLVQSQTFALGVTERAVGLNEDNFNAERPEFCDVAWGFNWIISRAMPWLIERARDTLADAVADSVAGAIEDFGGSLNEYLAVGITWPFDLPPSPPFYATVGLWPQAVSASQDGFELVLGADVTFDPDERGWLPENELASVWLTKPRAHLPSFLGIGNDLIGAIIAAANDGGLFTARIDHTVWPEAADLLTAGGLKALLPDLSARFADETPLNISLSGAESTHTAIKQDGDDVAVDLRLTNLRLHLAAGEQAYYALRADALIRLTAAYDRSNRRLSLRWRALNLVYKGGTFAPDLVPAPTDPRFVQAALKPWAQALYTQLAGSGDGPGLDLPALGLGGYRLTPEGVSVRDDLVTLDARLLPN